MITTEILPDDEALRLERRARILAEMEAANVDVLVLGREANARYISGVPRLWLAGTRPFGAGCLLVRATGAIHLLSPWDEGVPDDIPRGNLYGYTFNGANQMQVLKDIKGSDTFRTIATDALGPGAGDMLLAAFPNGAIVDGEPILQRARRIKTAAEIDAIRAAARIAERCLSAATATARPGVTGRQLVAAYMHEMGAAAICMPSTQEVAWITSRSTPWLRAPIDQTVVAGDLVSFEGGIMLDGYTAEIGRTIAVGGASNEATRLLQRGDQLMQRLLEICRPGTTGADLLSVYESEGAALPPFPIAHGLGLGFDVPLVVAALPRAAAAERLEPGMVLAITAALWQEGVGGVFQQAAIAITADGVDVLSTGA